MFNTIVNKLSSFYRNLSMSSYERYLSEATDVADLERRIQYGYRPEKYNHVLYPYGKWE